MSREPAPPPRPQSTEHHHLADDGTFPNSRHPALVYRQVLSGAAEARARGFERLFSGQRWPAAWRNGIFSHHHYHSTAHEVIGVYSGWVSARLGGEGGAVVELRAGDVVVIPAGVAHKNEGQSGDFRCVGAYPRGTQADMCVGRPGERPRVDENLAAVPVPELDPVLGGSGPLVELWR